MTGILDRIPHRRTADDPPGCAWYPLEQVLEANERSLDQQLERLETRLRRDGQAGLVADHLRDGP